MLTQRFQFSPCLTHRFLGLSSVLAVPLIAAFLHQQNIYRLPFLASLRQFSNQQSTSFPSMSSSPFYSFQVNDISHKPYDLNQLKGKVVMIVNTASGCGFTPQYKGLEGLYKQYKDRGLVILGFPCNQFGGQEPEGEEGIKSFCELNFGVSFPLMEKVDVNGDTAHPLFEWLKNEKKQLLMARIKWNFEKFLLDKEGKVVERYASTTTPESIGSRIESLL